MAGIDPTKGGIWLLGLLNFPNCQKDRRRGEKEEARNERAQKAFLYKESLKWKRRERLGVYVTFRPFGEHSFPRIFPGQEQVCKSQFLTFLWRFHSSVPFCARAPKLKSFFLLPSLPSPLNISPFWKCSAESSTLSNQLLYS